MVVIILDCETMRKSKLFYVASGLSFLGASILGYNSGKRWFDLAFEILGFLAVMMCVHYDEYLEEQHNAE